MNVLNRVFGLRDIRHRLEPIIAIPMSAKIQTGPAGVWPWASESAAQVAAMGSRAMAKRTANKRLSGPTVAQILSAASMLRSLVADAGDPIAFEARRPAGAAHSHDTLARYQPMDD